MANTLYDVLEVIPTASAEPIHAAYRSLMIRYHPDKVATLAPRMQEEATARTQEINLAYDTLGDVARRADYDEELRAREQRQLPVIFRQPRRTAAVKTKRRPLAAVIAATAGAVLVVVLPAAANLVFSAIEYSLTGHSRFFYVVETPAEAKGEAANSIYLPVLWGWLFANYLVGLVSYRLAVVAGEMTARRSGGSLATNDRLFLFLTFVGVVAVSELFYTSHTLGSAMAGMFILAGAYLAERMTPVAT